MAKSVILTPAHIDRLKSGSLADREVPGLSIIVPGPDGKQWRFKGVVAGIRKTAELVLGVSLPSQSMRRVNGQRRPARGPREAGMAFGYGKGCLVCAQSPSLS